MAYSQSKKLTTAEKKLQILKAQLYGKNEVVTAKSSPSLFTNAVVDLSSKNHHLSTSHEITFLKKDLIKTLIFATLAITIQITVYFVLQSRL